MADCAQMMCTNGVPKGSASRRRTSSPAGSKAVDETVIVNHSSLPHAVSGSSSL